MVRPENKAIYLPEEQDQKFHCTVAHLLFLSAWARRDIQSAVAFLTTRVKKPDENDWFKLQRVIKYLKGTISLKLNLIEDDLYIIKWYVDASYAIHDDCKGHTGVLMSMGGGYETRFYCKYKMNGRRSTEAELIGTHDAMPPVQLTKNFIKAQGYDINENIMYQDNKSTILLASNVKMSSSKMTKHIHVRFF